MATQQVIDAVKNYLRSLHQYGIHANQGIIFGSHARGDNRPDSDIDLIVIAPELDKMKDRRYIDALWQATVGMPLIEPIACGEVEWQHNYSRVILDVARHEGLTVIP